MTARGPVAQGIEQQPSKLKVGGSNPPGVANKIKLLEGNNGVKSSRNFHPGSFGEKTNADVQTLRAEEFLMTLDAMDWSEVSIHRIVSAFLQAERHSVLSAVAIFDR